MSSLKDEHVGFHAVPSKKSKADLENERSEHQWSRSRPSDIMVFREKTVKRLDVFGSTCARNARKKNGWTRYDTSSCAKRLSLLHLFFAADVFADTVYGFLLTFHTVANSDIDEDLWLVVLFNSVFTYLLTSDPSLVTSGAHSIHNCSADSMIASGAWKVTLDRKAWGWRSEREKEKVRLIWW